MLLSWTKFLKPEMISVNSLYDPGKLNLTKISFASYIAHAIADNWD
jgi:hypothetical protein